MSTVIDAPLAWRALVALAKHREAGGGDGPLSVVVATSGALVVTSRVADPGGAVVESRAPGSVSLPSDAASEPAAVLVDRYGPLCRPVAASGSGARSGSFVVAHLGQSLDGCIGPPSGEPEAITGPADMEHNHRMRALFDAVLVGAGTVCHDDPQLTVRLVEGANPVRVVVDPERRLSREYGLFAGGEAPTLLLCRRGREGGALRHGAAEVVPVDDGCSPTAVVSALADRGLRRVFVEGGGVTVSRFLEARCLQRLQLAMSPLIMGRGRVGLDLSQTLRLRPRVRRYALAEDVLFECCFDEEGR